MVITRRSNGRTNRRMVSSNDIMAFKFYLYIKVTLLYKRQIFQVPMGLLYRGPAVYLQNWKNYYSMNIHSLGRKLHVV